MPGLDGLLGGHEVHLWYVHPETVVDERLLAAYRAMLSREERDRNARFVFAIGRHDHLVTRALVRTTLSHYHPAVEPGAWQFTAGPFGRPEVAGPACEPPLPFNLSHTDGLIVCLVAVGREVGVDVEDVTRATVGGVEIADRFFSPAEVAELRALPPDAQRDRFFDYWTLKEAYIKARGLGLQLPLDQFSIHLDAGSPSAARSRDEHPSRAPIRISFGPRIDDDPSTWQLGLLRPTPRHRLAVAIRRQPEEPDLIVQLFRFVPTMPSAPT